MPKRLRIIVIVLVLVLASGAIYLLLDKKDEAQTDAAKTAQQNPPLPQSQSSNTQTSVSGSYVDYSPETLASAEGRRILFFHAPWCPQCRQLDESIKSETIPNDVTIFKVDYDSNQKLRQQYGVTIQTTLVLLDDKGNEVKKYVAYDQPNLDAVKENLLR